MENLTEQIEETIIPDVEPVEEPKEQEEQTEEPKEDVVEESTPSTTSDMDAKYGSAFVVQREFERALGKEVTRHVQGSINTVNKTK